MTLHNAPDFAPEEPESNRANGGHGFIAGAGAKMIVLVDFDNLRGKWRRRPLRRVIELIVAKLDLSDLEGGSVFRVRLYGGWFLKKRSSPNANRVSGELNSSDLPTSVKVSDAGAAYWVQVRVELATALALDPKQDLTHTYRPRSGLPSLRCQKLPFDGCEYPHDCEIRAVRGFVRGMQCPAPNCSTSLSRVLWRPEQKLVDSMMVADLARYAKYPERPVVVVSGDDDLWPGIRVALLGGVRVTHLIPDGHKRQSQMYNELTTELYSRLAI